MLLLETGSFIFYFPFRYIWPACPTSDLLMSDVPLALLVPTKEFYNTFDQKSPDDFCYIKVTARAVVPVNGDAISHCKRKANLIQLLVMIYNAHHAHLEYASM